MGKRGKIVFIACTVIIAVSALLYGVKLRRDIFVETQEIHFTLDVHNAYLWGNNARTVGIFNLYDAFKSGQRFPSETNLDYTPLRLLAVTTWQAWTQRHFPDRRELLFDYDFTAPMLWGNTIAAMLSSVFVFLLVRMWSLKMYDAYPASTLHIKRKSVDEPLDISKKTRVAPPFTGVIRGMIAALLLWFNPALLRNSYVWPQWDAWLLPFALAAIYLACLDWWFCAGVCLAIGASLKGQLLIAAPIMFLWPLFSFRFGALMRIAAGFLLMSMMIALPWMKPSGAAITWYSLTIAAMGLVIPIVLRWRLNPFILSALGVVAVLLAWPWTSQASFGFRLLPITIVGVVALMRWIPAAIVPQGCALLVSGVIALIIPLYDGHTAWYSQGFVYGPNREQTLHGPTANNLPNILQTYFRWPNNAHFKVDFLWLHDIEMQSLMAGIYGVCLVLCGIGAAMQFKRNDARFLIAMFLPWLLFFLLLTQIRGRYLVWAAALSALLVSNGLGLTLLGLIITAISLLQMMQNQAILDRQYFNIQPPAWFPDIAVLEPHLGWLLLLIAAILLFHTLSPRRKTELV